MVATYRRTCLVVGDPTLIAANKRGEAAEVTTTAAPAS